MLSDAHSVLESMKLLALYWSNNKSESTNHGLKHLFPLYPKRHGI